MEQITFIIYYCYIIMKHWFYNQMSEYIDYFFYYVQSVFTHPIIKLIFSAVIVALSFLFWEVDILVISTAVIYIIDFGLGIYTAFKNDNFNPARFWGWMAKLIFYAILVILFHQADHIIQEMVWHHIELEIISARSWALAYIWSHELLSALNKLKNLWIPIPQKLYNMIKTNKDKLDL